MYIFVDCIYVKFLNEGLMLKLKALKLTYKVLFYTCKDCK